MATVQENRTKPARVAERDPQVYHPLDRLRGIIRRYVVIEGVLLAVLFLALWFMFGLIFDYGVFKVSGWDWAQDGARWVRGAALIAAVVLFLALLFFRLVRRLTTEFSYPSLALVLERRFPKVLGDRLITAVEMADVEAMGKFGYSKEMLRATIAEARERVGKVPVSEVFNWRRLWVLGFITVGILLLTVAFSYASYAVAAKSTSPYRFGWRFAHVSGIFFERNVALMNTPWPRRAHLEVIGFPEDELTVGRDVKPPDITARAYRWVIVDRSSPHGWRPLRWSDLNQDFVGRSVPELPPKILAAGANEPGGVSVDTVELMAYETDEEVTPQVAAARAEIKQEMNFRLVQDASAPSGWRTVESQSYEELQEVIKALIAKADQPGMGRTLRRLDAPTQVTYRWGSKRGDTGTGDFAARANNEFVGKITDKNGNTPPETVDFILKAENFSTLPHRIRPIPPPSLRRLGREQSEPAYLHHAPPQGEGYNALKGKLQKVLAKDLTLTGDQTVFAVPAGTDLTLIAEAYTADDGSISDNDRIVSAYAIPETGRFPGTVFDKDGKPTQTPVPLTILDNGMKFQIEFHNKPRDPNAPAKPTDHRLMDNVRFKVTWTNKYNVSATRTISIQVVPDQPPTVEVAVDVIRKLGNFYLVTPNAKIPFNPDSFIKDDRGLSKVEYTFEYWAEDSDVVRSLRAKYALRSLMDVPLPGTTPSAFMPRLHADNFRFLDKADDRLNGSVFVSEFSNQFSTLRRDTRAQFEAMLAVPKSEDVVAQTVKKIELRDPSRDFFDLKELGDRGIINIRPKESDVQAIYRMDLNVQATDNNVDNETGPRVVKNSEPIRLRIVSEGDLLIEISKEEDVLAARLDEALLKLAAAKRKYEFVRNTNGYKEETPDQVDAVKVRAQDALGDVDKARDVVQSVGREFHRLSRECRINRLNNAAQKLYDEFADDPDQILAETSNVYGMTFPKVLTMLNGVQNTLNGSRWAPLAAVSDAENAIYALERDLTTIRKKHGEAQSLAKLKASVEQIKRQQEQIRQQILTWQKIEDDKLKNPAPTFGAVGVLTFAKGDAKVIQQTISWNQYKEDDIVVKFAVYDMNNNPVADALTVPAELKLNFDKHQFRFDYQVKAGNKEGTFKIRLTPAVGPPVEYQVIVK